jgi:selenocysteine lyase/cysteine desulfurase
LTEGGSGVDSFSEAMPLLLPERYEAGTLSTPAIASLNAGIEFLNKVGMDSVEQKLIYMTSVAIDELKSIPGISIYGANNGIISFNIKDYSSSYVSDFLDTQGFATRSGYHCAPLIHKKIGTLERGAVRMSLSYFNKESEIYALRKVLRNI